MHKKFIKLTIERHDVTENYDENFFDEYYIQEDEFTNWASQQKNLGWVVKCEETVIFCTPENVEFPKVILIREVEDKQKRMPMNRITTANIREVIARGEAVRISDVASRLYTTNKQAVRKQMNKMVCRRQLSCEKFKYIGNADICVYRKI